MGQNKNLGGGPNDPQAIHRFRPPSCLGLKKWRFHFINQKIFGLHSVSREHSGFHLIQNNNRIPLKGANFWIIPFPFGIFVGINGNH